MPSQRSAPLPRGWSKHVKSGLLHAISLAAMALTVARSRYARSRLQARLGPDRQVDRPRKEVGERVQLERGLVAERGPGGDGLQGEELVEGAGRELGQAIQTERRALEQPLALAPDESPPADPGRFCLGGREVAVLAACDRKEIQL